MSEEIDYSKVPGTWAYELDQHWKAFNACVTDMWDNGHEKKIDYWKWRDYVLWDMQKRHEKEKNEQIPS